MRLFAVGDIHGCGTAFDVILAAIQLQANDKIVCLGDYINKGPETRAVLDRLLQLSAKGLLVPLLGNHELKLITALQIKQPQFKQTTLVDRHTLSSYGGKKSKGSLEDIPERHWRFVAEECLHWFTTDSHIFVHATLDDQKPLPEQSPSTLFWDKFSDPQPHCSGKPWSVAIPPSATASPLIWAMPFVWIPPPVKGSG
jgi:serine/threonine protein phosphatase 1